MVACMPHARQLTRDLLSRVNPTPVQSSADSNRGVFINRSLATINTAGEDVSGTETIASEKGFTLVLHDEGKLLRANYAESSGEDKVRQS